VPHNPARNRRVSLDRGDVYVDVELQDGIVVEVSRRATAARNISASVGKGAGQCAARPGAVEVRDARRIEKESRGHLGRSLTSVRQ
jgi:hypothetical protein